MPAIGYVTKLSTGGFKGHIKTLSIRAEVPQDGGRGNVTRYQQTLTVPQFLDVEKLTATHQHGMLRLSVPLKESVKPRRIHIEGVVDNQKRITSAAAR